MLAMIADSARITYRELAKSLGISEVTVMRKVRELKEAGKLQRKDSTRSEWVVINPNKK